MGWLGSTKVGRRFHIPPPHLFVIAIAVLAMIIQKKVESNPRFSSHWRGQAKESGSLITKVGHNKSNY